jgi:GH43 family beta-xylosidase
MHRRRGRVPSRVGEVANPNQQDQTFPEWYLFANPLVPGDSPDPWMVVHEGRYYFLHSEDETISIRSAGSIKQLYTARPVTVWRDATRERSRQMWAPELHRVGDKWYLYYCASDGDHLTHRCHVLESAGLDPLGPYHYKGKLRTDPVDSEYAIDAGLLQLPGGKLFLMWAGFPGHRVYISEMVDAWTTVGPRVLLPCDGFGCEEVREGPVTLVRNGRVFLMYSACDVGKPDYCVGVLEADVGADLLNPASWRQVPEPLLRRCDAHAVYGPGHHGVFKSPDGREDWIVYHGKSTPLFTYRYRTARAQRLSWYAGGRPYVGEPTALDQPLVVPGGDPGASLGPVW